MSVSLKRLLATIGLWIGVMILRVLTAPLHFSPRLEDSVFAVALLTVPLIGAILTITAALKESREGRYKVQAILAALGAVVVALAGLCSGGLIWLRLANPMD